MNRLYKRLFNKIVSCLLIMALVMASFGMPVNASEQTSSGDDVEVIGEIEILPEEEIQIPTDEPEDADIGTEEEEIIEEESEEEIIEEVEIIIEENPEENSEENPDEVIITEPVVAPVEADEDPMEVRYHKKVVDQASLIPISSVMTDEWPGSNDFSDRIYEYNHGIYSENINISKGIDVSKYQKDIDWEKVKADGVEFAFIRVGFRGYGSTGSLNDDIKYKDNIEGALRAGIPVGVYMFSQAVSVYEAIEEADYILERIEDYNITLPVIMDYEFAGDYGRLERAHLSREEATEVCNAFCERVSEEGYEAMLYADYGMLRDHLNPSQIEDKYKIWIARWNDATEYEGEYGSWQFSDIGRVEGISDSSGYIPTDLNFGYGLLDIPVTLNSRGGKFENEAEEITVMLEQGMSLLDADISLPKKANRTFRGWSDKEEINKAVFDFSAPIISCELELYAVWRKKKNKDKQNPITEPADDSLRNTQNGQGGVGDIYFKDRTEEVQKLTDVIMPKKQTLAGHIFVRFLDADSIGTDNIAMYKYISGGVEPKVELYYEPFGCDTTMSSPTENAILLTEGEDYRIRYINNRRASSYADVNRLGLNAAPTINIIGRKDYKGSENIRYTIYK